MLVILPTEQTFFLIPEVLVSVAPLSEQMQSQIFVLAYN